MKLIDLTGKKFGKWTVLYRTESCRSMTKWQCRCECGTEKSVYACHLRAGKSNGCHLCSTPRGKNHVQWKGYGDICGNYWDSITRAANGHKGKRKPVPMKISKKYAWELFLKQNKKCALSGIPLTINFSGTNGNGEHTASLDRIDSSKGYIKDNVQWVHKDINMMKRTYDQDYFINLCKKVALFNE